MVGPSGTGKSHRAIVVAHDYEADIIIDDGLLIQGNRIIAGVSAKRQPTRIGAIKAALFLDEQRAQEARATLEKVAPKKVLILGTSNEMVEKIALRLGLPGVKRIISIEEVASSREIRKARIMRSQFSKHVIPAPAVEVKRSFPGTLIDPLQVFLRLKGAPQDTKRSWLEQSVVRPTFTYYGKLTISRSALLAIAARAAEEVRGVKSAGKIHVDQREDSVIFELMPTIFFGYPMNEVSREIQALVRDRVEYMTGLLVEAVHVTVRDVYFEGKGFYNKVAENA